ncbi:MAG TPA: TonB-dependent receptor [Pyrinomonadaceae bacterium]
MNKLRALSRHRVFGLLVAILCLTTIITAQTESARVQGTVTDASGAAIAGATVTVTDAGTGRVVTAQTNEEGNYSILSLQPGRYQMSVTQTNFKTTRQDVTLEVAQNATLNFALEAGGVTEVVTISADVPQVETSTSAIGEVIQGREAVELPLNGRNVLELARLTPGVTQGVPGGFASGAGGNAETYRGGNTGGAALSVNGQRTQANNFLLDGVDNNESLVNTINVFPSAEAIQEFRVQTSVAPAEFGRGGGAIINSVIKSGRNDFYGSAYAFIRNSAFDARPTFFNSVANDRRTPLFRRGQFGGTFGGPLYIPGFGEGTPMVHKLKDKVFFFADYEGLRQFLPLGQDTATVPTTEFRNGNFAALSTQLRDPLTGLNVCVTGTTTNGNLCANGNGVSYNRLDLLPGGRLNQVALNYLRAFPLPNRPGTLNNYVTTRNQTTNSDTFDLRIDSNISTSNQIFGRVSWGRFDQTTSSRLPALPSGFGSGTNPIRTKGIVLGLNSVLSPSMFNELRVQANRIKYGYTPPFFDTPISAQLGIPNANRDASLGGGALIGGYNGQLEYTGDFGPYIVPQDTYQIVDSISYTTGNHTFKIGGTILRRDVALYRPNRGKGYFFLIGNGDPTQCGGAASTGFEQADLLIGFVCNYQIGPPFGTVGTRNWENAAFVQDDWRVSRKLTLNLGLRYEYFTNPKEQYGRQANFDITSGRLIVAGDNSNSLTNTDKNNFSPRVGFAYDIGGEGKSVIRGGYGIFYFLDRGGIDNQLAQNPPYSGFSVFNYTDGFRITLSGRAPNGSLDSRLATGALPLGDVSNIDLNNPQNVDVLAVLPDNKTANVQQFNVQYQRQLTNSTAVSVGYVGTRGRNLALYYNLNGRTIEAGTNVDCPRALVNNRCFPLINRVNVRDDNGRSRYDSLQLQLERRFTRGWLYRAAYTYSKTKDNGEGAFDSVGDTGINFIEPFATSRIDFPHVFSFASVWDIPFGRGRSFGSEIHPALDVIIGGWQLNGIYRYQSGSPYDIRVNGVRVDLVGEPYADDNREALNISAFRLPPTGRFGTLERNSLRTPNTSQLNLGLTKNFGIYERFKAQFRIEAFNVFNTPQFGSVGVFESNGSFNNSNPTTQLFTNRQLQLGLRLEF